ncbi:MAG TPA: universal stress protein [Bacteroidales bacterium]|nr:universal stress protein [Bacteroidales bacterium]
MKNILVSIDFGEKYSLLIDKASELAGKSGSKIWLLHVAAPDPDFVGYDVGPQYIRDFRAEDLKEEHKTLSHLVDLLEKNGFETEALLIQGATAEMVLSESQKLHVDLVILGHQEHSLLYETFVGSKSISIINKSKIPVLIVPMV